MPGLMKKLFGKKHEPQKCSVVIVAAGSASRMKGIDKVMTELGGIPVLLRTISVFQQCPKVCEIIVVTREDLLVEISEMCKACDLDKVSKIVVGGAERLHSVFAGVHQVRADVNLIAIHDAARPFLTQKVLDHVLEQAEKTGAAAPAIAVSDTIKRVADGLVTETVDRSDLRAIQTPQVFQSDLIRAALKKAVEDGESVTDDCAAVERLGMRVVLTEGDRENIKVTTPFDLILGEAILAARGER